MRFEKQYHYLEKKMVIKQSWNVKICKKSWNFTKIDINNNDNNNGGIKRF